MPDLVCSIKGTLDVRAHRLPQIPVALELKTGAELCCISSGNTASRKFHATNRAARTACDRIFCRKIP
jgi:hypothetical protein